MGLGTQAFTVLTEFKFDIGSAVTNSEAVAGSVDKISKAANNAQFAVARLSMSFAGSLIGGGGFMGAMFAASKIADEFANSQISLANTLVSTGMAFEDRMGAAAATMKELNKLAIDNSLSFKDLLGTTKMLTPMLLNKGLAGRNLGNVTDISRTFLKSAPTLGIDPGEAMGQLMRTMEGQASMGDTLFARLAAETAPMKEFLNNTKKWNALNPHKRVDILRKALAQFADDSGAVSARIKTLSGQVGILKNNIELLLMPLGTIINKFLATALARVNSPEVMKKAKAMSDSLARAMGNLLTTPERLLADMAQAKALSSNMNTAGNILTVAASIQGLDWAMKTFGLKIPIITGLVSALSGMITGLTGAAFGSGALALSGGIIGFFEGLTIIVSGILVPLGALVVLFQFFARAIHYSKMFALERINAALPRLFEIFAQFSGIFSILGDGFDLLAKGLGWLLDPTLFLGFIDLVSIFTSVMGFLAKVLGMAMMGFNGIALWLMEFVNQVKNLVTGKGFSMQQINDAGSFGMEEVYKRVFGQIEEGTGAVVNQNVQMDVKMQNNFKEMMEPDRVAFTIRDQLLKAARNQTGARDRGMEAAGAAAGR